MQSRHECEPYLRYCEKTARLFTRNPQDTEELTAELRYTLIATWDGFDPSRGANRRSYVLTRLRSRAMEWLRNCAPGRITRTAHAVLQSPELYSDEQVQRAEQQRNWAHPLALDAPLGIDGEGHPITAADVLAAPDDTEAAVLSRIEAEEIACSLYALPERERTLLALHYGHGLNAVEVTERMGFSLFTFSRLHTAGRAHLAAVLEVSCL